MALSHRRGSTSPPLCKDRILHMWLKSSLEMRRGNRCDAVAANSSRLYSEAQITKTPGPASPRTTSVQAVSRKPVIQFGTTQQMFIVLCRVSWLTRALRMFARQMTQVDGQKRNKNIARNHRHLGHAPCQKFVCLLVCLCVCLFVCCCLLLLLLSLLLCFGQA